MYAVNFSRVEEEFNSGGERINSLGKSKRMKFQKSNSEKKQRLYVYLAETDDSNFCLLAILA